MATHTDDFNRADSGTLGANWVDIDPGFYVSGNRAKASGGTAIVRYNATIGNDQYAQSAIYNATVGNNCVGVRMGAGPVGYVLRVYDAAHWSLRKNKADGPEIGSGAMTFSDGDVMRLEAEGTSLRVYHNGVLKGTITDSSYSSGGVGLATYGVGVDVADNWEGGDLAPAPTVTDFNTTESCASNATGIVATGMNLTSATAKITQDAVDISQTVTATSSTTVTNSIVGWATGGVGRYSAASTTYTATTGAGSSTPLAITVNPPSGKDYVVATSAGGASWQVGGSPEIAIGNEIEFDTTSSTGSTIDIGANLSVTETGGNHTATAITFAPATGVAPSTVSTSASQTITGVNCTFAYRISDGVWGTSGAGTIAYTPAISVTNGEYQINSGSWVSTPGTVAQGDTVKVRRASSGSYNTAVTVTLHIDSDDYVYSITTAAEPAAVLSAPTPSGTISFATHAAIGATTDIMSGTLYVVVSTTNNVATATATQIKTGKNSTGAAAAFSGNASVVSVAPSVNITGLTLSTLYYYAIVQNSTAGDSNIVSGTFTTGLRDLSGGPYVVLRRRRR